MRLSTTARHALLIFIPFSICSSAQDGVLMSPSELKAVSGDLKSQLDSSLPGNRIQIRISDGLGTTPGRLESLENLLRRQLQVIRPYEPDSIAKEIEQIWAKPCADEQSDLCKRRVQLLKIANILRDAEKVAPGCAAAAQGFIPYYEAANPPREIAQSFDTACLASFEPRLVGAVEERPAGRPKVFDQGGATEVARGALSAVGILEEDGTPFCGALLLNDHTLVTAWHCYDHAYSKLPQGRVSVRPILGARGPWKVAAAPVSKPVTINNAVRNDWVRLGIDTTDAIGASVTRLIRAPDFNEVTVVGYFAHDEGTTYSIGATQAGMAYRSLRYPRPGLCHTIEISNGCLKLACQTVRGFSGSPIFSVSQDANSPIDVVGFISQPNQITSSCPGMRNAGATLAVSADLVE
jgi:V8-like Glu-specific endopeptidase